MNFIALLALLLTIAGWILTGLTGINLLSGHFDERTCLTDCVKILFFSAVAAGFVGLVLSGIALKRPNGRILSGIALLSGLGLCSVFVVLFVAGNFI